MNIRSSLVVVSLLAVGGCGGGNPYVVGETVGDPGSRRLRRCRDGRAKYAPCPRGNGIRGRVDIRW